MISLLLTLFISVFSFCPSVNRLEDHNENTITINETQIVKNVADYNGIAFFTSMTDLMSTSFLENMIYFTVQNYGVAFRDGTGTAYSIQLQNEPIELFDITDLNYENPFADTPVLSQLMSLACDSTRYTHYTVYYINFNFANSSYNFYLQFFSFDMYDSTNEDSASLSGDLDNVLCRLGSGGSYFNYSVRGLLFSRFDLSEEVFNLFTNIGTTGSSMVSYNDGYNAGLGVGYDRGWYDGKSSGYQEGYYQALEDTQGIDTTASTIFNGALEIGLLPVNFFLSIFNFEVFGINIKSIVSALLTLGVVIIIVRFLFGGKENDK